MEPCCPARVRLIPLLVAGIAALAATTVRAGELPKRTLGELLELARQHAPTVAAAQAQVDVRRAQRSEAIRNWAPFGEITFAITGVPAVQCDVSAADQAEYQRRLASDPNGAVQFRKDNCVNTIDPGNHSTVSFLNFNIAGVGGQLQASLTQPIYTFGKIEHGTKAAELGVEAEQQKVEMARREAEVNVARAYWGWKAARTSLATAREGKEELDDWVKKIAEDLEKDKPQYSFSINDLQRLKVAVSQLDMVLADIERNLGIARRGMRAAVGEETDIDDAELDAAEVVERPYEFYEQAALGGRPEVRALNAGVGAYRELAKFNLSQMLPDIALNLGFTYRFAPTIEDASNGFMNKANGWGFGAYLGLRQPLDFVQKHSHWARARAEADAMDAQRRLALAGIAFELAQAYENLGESRRRLEATDRGQKVSRGWFNAVKQNMDVGTAEARDLVDAARAYFEARLRYYQAIFDFNVNIAVLRRAAAVDIAPARATQ